MVVSSLTLSLIAASIALSIIKSNPSVVFESTGRFCTRSTSAVSGAGVVATSSVTGFPVVAKSRVASSTVPVISSPTAAASSTGKAPVISVFTYGVVSGTLLMLATEGEVCRLPVNVSLATREEFVTELSVGVGESGGIWDENFSVDLISVVN